MSAHRLQGQGPESLETASRLTTAPRQNIPEFLARNTVILPHRNDLENLAVGGSPLNISQSAWSVQARPDHRGHGSPTIPSSIRPSPPATRPRNRRRRTRRQKRRATFHGAGLVAPLRTEGDYARRRVHVRGRTPAGGARPPRTPRDTSRHLAARRRVGESPRIYFRL